MLPGDDNRIKKALIQLGGKEEIITTPSITEFQKSITKAV
jgi:hypothetical protein